MRLAAVMLHVTIILSGEKVTIVQRTKQIGTKKD